jgi:hypothetical protein
MGRWQHNPCADYRNEGWGVHGSGVSRMWECWSSTDDTKYCSCPSNKGRGTVSFPLDITNVPDGAVISSVTIMVRAAKTSSSGRYSLTINLVPSDDTSKFTTRTLNNLTTSPADYEVATYKADPLNNPWDRNRINKILCQVFSYCGVLDGVRVYRFYTLINYHVRPTLSVDAPSGTVTTPSPTVSWTYSQTDGDPQRSAEWKIFTSDQQEAVQFSPDTATPVASGTVTGDTTSVVTSALVPDEYYAYVRVQSSFYAKSVWTSRAFTVAGAAPGVPGGGTGGGGSIGTGAGAGFVSVVADNSHSSAYLAMRDGSNLLGVQAANFENSTDWLGYITTNCAVARDVSTAFNVGSGCMKMTATGAGTMQATGAFVEIQENTPITARVQIKSASTSRTVNYRVLFYDDQFATVAGTLSGNAVDSSTTWTEVMTTGSTPAGVSYARVQIEVVSAGASESHYVDAVGLMYGTNSVWSHGGHTSRNMLSTIASTAELPLVGNEPWGVVNLASSYARASNSGTGADGTNAFRMTYVGISPTLSWVATGSVYSDTSTSSGYTLNKPAGIANGDLYVAYVATADATTITPPTGWTLVNTSSYSYFGVTLHVLIRDALAADPSTWVGNLSANSSRRRTIVIAYRGAAAAADQFTTQNVSYNGSNSPVITSGAINNATTNGWRLFAIAARDDVAGSTAIANINPPAAIPPITFVGAATNWGRIASATTYTINKPSGVISGDLMLAQVTAFGACTVNAPSGWTVVRQTTQTDATGSCTQAILKRTAGGSEPNSWGGTLSTSRRTVHTQAIAYRNCLDASLQFLADAQSTSDSGSSITTATINNTDSSGMRVSAFAATTGVYAWWYSYNTNEKVQRSVGRMTYDSAGEVNNISATFFDSNGGFSTGNTNRQATLDNSYYAAVSWIGIIKPLTAAPPPGANESESTDGVVGAADPFIQLAAYDSNGTVGTGPQSVTGVVTPGTGSAINCAVSWIGILKPATPTVAGEVATALTDYIDISKVDPLVIQLANSKVTVQATFLGSVPGTPYLSVQFYNGNEKLTTLTAQGVSFNTTVWTKSAATFTMPTGTTRMKIQLSVRDRAISDVVYFDRVSLSFGDSTVYRSGTGGDAHVVWSNPIVEFAEDLGDGYGDWQQLPGTVSAPPLYDQLTGLTTFDDQTLTPLAYRKYRAKTVSYGLLGDKFESAYGKDSPEVSVTAAEWWLKDPKDSSNSIQLKVWNDELEVSTTGTAAVFQPLGADRPNVLTEGYKGDRIEITVIVNRAQFAELRALLKSGRTLFLQSNMDNAWWVRPIGDIGAATKATGQRNTNPLRFVKLAFTEVSPEM